MNRQVCPICHKKLPFFMFRADLKIKSDQDSLVFYCANCRARLQAKTNGAHQKNFFWVVASPILALIVMVSINSYIPSYIRPIYYFLGIGLSLVFPVVSGQHKMDLSPFEGSEPQ